MKAGRGPGNRRRSEPTPGLLDALAALIDQAPFGLAIFDTDLRYVQVSDGLSAMHGQTREQALGRRVDEVLPAPFGAMVAGWLREVLDTGRPMVDGESWGTPSDPQDRRCFVSSIYRLDGADGMPVGLVAFVTEVTDERRSRAEARAAINSLHRLQDVTAALAASRDIGEVGATVLSSAARAVGAGAVALLEGTTGGGELRLVATAGMTADAGDRLRTPVGIDEHVPSAEVVRTGRPVLWSSLDERATRYPDLGAYPADHPAWAFLPLTSGGQISSSGRTTAEGRPLGVICFGWDEPRLFTEEELSMLDAVARQCGVALERAQLLGEERETNQVVELLALVARSIIEADADGVFALSEEGRALAYNQRFFDVLGIPEDIVHLGGDTDGLMRACLNIVADAETAVAHIQHALLKPFEPFDIEIDLSDGRTLGAHSAPVLYGDQLLGRVWYVRDETARHRREEVQRSLLAHFQAQQDRQAFLLHASELVSAADDYEEALEQLAAAAVPTLGDLCLVDVLTWDDRVVRMAARHADPDKQPLAELLRDRYGPSADGIHPSVDVMRTGRIRWSARMDGEFLRSTTRDDEHLALVQSLGFSSYMSVPIFAEARILGAITLVSAGSGRRFSEKDITLAQEFAARVAQVVANVHRNDSARLAAHTLQASLLPAKLPDVDGLSICAQYLPATIDHEVGGDFYDVLPSAGGGALLLVGDVSGHDIAAAAVMGKIRTAARALAGQTDEPLRLLEMLHESWPYLEADRLATILVTGLSPAGDLTIVSAGHPAPLVVTADSAGYLEVDPSAPLGAPGTDLRPWHGQLDRGSAMLLFTDGLIEDRQRGFADGAAKLRHVARGHTEPTDLCERVLEAFVLHEERHDDIAVLAVRRAGVR